MKRYRAVMEGTRTYRTECRTREEAEGLARHQRNLGWPAWVEEFDCHTISKREFQERVRMYTEEVMGGFIAPCEFGKLCEDAAMDMRRAWL